MSELEIRLIGKPADVDATVAEMRALFGARLKLRGRQDSRSGAGKVIQYGRFAPASPPAAPASPGQPGPTSGSAR